MLINDKDATARLNSPLNLMNRLAASQQKNNRKNAMSLFIRPSDEKKITPVDFNPFQKKETKEPQGLVEIPQQSAEPDLNQIIDSSDTQIKLGLAHDNALKLLNASVDALSTKLDDVKADKLPAVISAASKVVEGIRRERNEAAKQGLNKEVHYHFYTPEQKSVKDYGEVIDVG